MKNLTKTKESTLTVVGMHCASCASVIKKKVEKLNGVETCTVNYASEKAQVSYDPKKVHMSDMNNQIAKLGYSLQEQSEHMDHPVDDLDVMRRHIAIILPMVAISIGIMTWEIGAEPFGLWPKMNSIVMGFFHHLLPIFATYALFVVGLPYIKGMIRFFRYRVANMDSLVGIGTSVAFLYSFIISAFEGPLAQYLNVEQNYYDVTIVVIGFITLGKYLEAKSKLKTGEAIEKLMNLQVKRALVIRDGAEIELAIDDLQKGDVMIVKPGQKIPLDGEIIRGETSIDESMITGEPIPVDKKVGDGVIGSTINKQGSIQVKATKIGADTMLSQIIEMVKRAQGSKAPIEKLADSVSAIFVPVVMAIAVIVLVLWLGIGSQFMPFSQALTLGILSFVGILVIACPCAMGLATPTAIIVGVGKAAQNGILIKNAESLQSLSTVNYVVLDKTGTITKGAPEVSDISPVGSFTQKNVLSIVASLETHSEHPLAQAVVARAHKDKVVIQEVKEFSAIEGKGLKGKIGTNVYFAGNLSLVKDRGLKADESIVNTFASQGKTPVVLMNSKEIIAYLGIADTVKPEAREVIRALLALNIKVAMLTGDNRKTADYIGKRVGIDTVIAEVLPADKAGQITKLMGEGYKVAMVGDGINDAPALATAHVGIAMGTGTDVAIESAGLTLLGGQLSKLPKAISLARSTMNIVKQNLFWAFVYNIIGIPIAAGVLYPVWGILLNPAIAGGAMGLSSVSVVLNSLRLKSQKV